MDLIFLKYISDAFEELYERLKADEANRADPEDKDEYKAENVFFVRQDARWSNLQSKAKQPEIGKFMDDAMDAIKKENASLKSGLGILGYQAVFNQAACRLIANDKICCKEFFYLYLKNQRSELNAMASGSSQQNLNVGKIKTYPAFIPDDLTMTKFKKEVTPIFDKIGKNTTQIRTLTALRESLLPKLMSCEVRVKTC